MSKININHISIENFNSLFRNTNNTSASEIIIPEFQRKYVWKDQQMTYLIETILLNYPIPPVILKKEKTPDNRSILSVVDGQQRLTTIKNFIENSFKMKWSVSTKEEVEKEKDPSKKKSLKEIIESTDGKYFFEFDTAYRNKFSVYEISYWNLDENLNASETISMFSRMNNNSINLNKHEIRNASFQSLNLELINSSFSGYVEEMIQKKIFTNLQIARMIYEEFMLYLVSYVTDGNIDESSTYLDEFAMKVMSFSEDEIKSSILKVKKTIDEVLEVYNTDGFMEKWFRGKTYFFAMFKLIFDNKASVDKILEAFSRGNYKTELENDIEGKYSHSKLIHSKSIKFKEEVYQNLLIFIGD